MTCDEKSGIMGAEDNRQTDGIDEDGEPVDGRHHYDVDNGGAHVTDGGAVDADGKIMIDTGDAVMMTMMTTTLRITASS